MSGVCLACGGKLPPNLKTYCSNDCRWVSVQFREPKNNQERQEFDKLIEQGKQRLRQLATGYNRVIDDSPSTERELRERICPNPQFYYRDEDYTIKYSTVRTVQDPTDYEQLK